MQRRDSLIRSKFDLILIIISVALCAFTGCTEANTYYVAKGYSDNNPGTQSQPWGTIQKAANTVAPGDVVYIRGGIYNEVVGFYNSGSESNPIKILAYPGEAPVVDGNNIKLPNWGLLFEVGGNYIQVSGLEVRFSTAIGVYVSGDFNTLTGINSHDNTDNGILVDGGNYDTVEDCRVWNNCLNNYKGLSTEDWASGLSAGRSNQTMLLRYMLSNNLVEGLSIYQIKCRCRKNSH
jgi:hypothetical protein